MINVQEQLEQKDDLSSALRDLKTESLEKKKGSVLSDRKGQKGLNSVICKAIDPTTIVIVEEKDLILENLEAKEIVSLDRL
jgi:hypothetical protein